MENIERKPNVSVVVGVYNMPPGTADAAFTVSKPYGCPQTYWMI